MVHHGCDVALEALPIDTEAGEKIALMKNAYNTLILCLGDCVLREVTKETIVAQIWTKLTSLYMTNSLANRLYLKKKLYKYYMSPGMKLADHIDELKYTELHVVSYGIDSVARPLLLFFSFENRLLWFRVGTTHDIFQNIILIPYLKYGVLILSGYGVLIFDPLWSLLGIANQVELKLLLRSCLQFQNRCINWSEDIL
ncbi:hypothetical protein Tco_0426200 [Tanacetum coccineum]